MYTSKHWVWGALLCLHLSTAFAQNLWQLFPYQQRTYWQRGDTLHRYDCDSIVRVFGNARLHLIGGGYLTQQRAQPCYTNALQAVRKVNKPPVDTFLVEGNVWRTTLPNGQTFPFYPDTRVGDHWTANVQGSGFEQIRVTCTQQRLVSVLGVLDSVKTFVVDTRRGGQSVPTSWSGATFELTQSYGFRQWYPFSAFAGSLPLPLVLAGVARTGTRMGYTHDFSDYFQRIKPGVVLKYRIAKEDRQGGTVEIARDSVLTVTTEAHKKRIEVARKSVITSAYYTGNLPDQTRHEKQTYAENIVEWSYTAGPNDRFQRTQTPNWFWFDGHSWERHGSLVRGAADGWVSSIAGLNVGRVQPCNDLYDGCRYYDVYNTTLGMVESSVNCFGSSNRTQLLGFFGDGIAWGDYRPVSLSTHAFPEEALLALTPNPVTEQLRVEMPPTVSEFHYQIFNAAGQVVRTGKANSPVLTLPIAELMSGLYFLQIRTPDGGQAVRRFVKN